MKKYMDSLKSKDVFWGAVAVSQNGKTVYSTASGYADAGKKIPNSAQTRFRIGSITKTFTAVLMMKAVEEGKIKLSDPLSKYIPQVHDAQKITLEMLLKHRSGLFNITEDPDLRSWYLKPQSRGDIIRRINAQPLKFFPNSKYEYSNSNYALLGFILQDVYGVSYEQLLQDKICRPLQLQNTTTLARPEATPLDAASYYYDTNGWVRDDVTDSSVAIGAGNISSTTEELLVFIEALFRGKLLQKSSVDAMIQMQDAYGYGIYQVPFYEYKGYGHNGRIDNFTSALYYFPEMKTGFVSLSNGSQMENNDIAIAALSAATDRKIEYPKLPKEIMTAEGKLKPEIVIARVGVYAAEGFPLKITIFEKEGKLFGQATGQEAFPLSITTATEMSFEPAKIKMDFNEKKSEFLFTQFSNKFIFKKEK